LRLQAIEFPRKENKAGAAGPLRGREPAGQQGSLPEKLDAESADARQRALKKKYGILGRPEVDE